MKVISNKINIETNETWITEVDRRRKGIDMAIRNDLLESKLELIALSADFDIKRTDLRESNESSLYERDKSKQKDETSKVVSKKIR